MSGTWMDYGKGLKLSSVNTLHLIDDEEFAQYLLARQIECEYPPCKNQAVGVAKNCLPFYYCDTHLTLTKFARTSATGIKVILACMSAMKLEVEHAKSMYCDWRDNTESITVTKQPGVQAIDAAVVKAANLESLDAAVNMPDSGLDIDLFL